MSGVEAVKSAADKLEKNFSEKQKVLLGFDGFVDEIIDVVKKRHNATQYDKMTSMKEFAEVIAAMAGKAGSCEMVPVDVRLGGNGPLMANSLLAQGYDVTYIGAIGKHNIDPAYTEFNKNCSKVISLCDPGNTGCLEFHDGKLMQNKSANLVEVNWDTLLSKISVQELQGITKGVKLLAMTNWSKLPNFNSLFKGFGEHVLAKIDTKPVVFVDFADATLQPNENIVEGLKCVSALQQYTPVIQGFNEPESECIQAALGINEKEITTRAEKIRAALKISQVIIHPISKSAINTDEGTKELPGPYCAKPILTTGGGDNYNAGYVTGYMNGCNPQECLATACCNSGFYVRNARPPTVKELVTFMRQWAEKDLGAI